MMLFYVLATETLSTEGRTIDDDDTKEQRIHDIFYGKNIQV